MSETAPTWKFWHPLAFWKVLVVAFVAQIVCTLPLVALAMLADVHIPQWVAGGFGGLLMVVVVRRLAANAPTDDRGADAP